MNQAGPRTIGLGLQGGGSHAAFAWGALERLLDEIEAGRLRVSAVSGTSGGALNAAALVYGLIDSPAEARRRLAQLWTGVSRITPTPPDFMGAFLQEGTPSRWNVDWAPSALVAALAEQLVSPYANPFYVNGLDNLIREVIPDFAALNRDDSAAPRLFVCATDVAETRRRIFGRPDLSAEALLAAACYPTLFRAIEIDDVALWDGGYMGNPALRPLLSWADDLLTVMINPLDRTGGPPRTAREIMDRINEIGFNTAWVMEVRQIQLVNELIEKGWLTDGPHTVKRFHVIRDDAFMQTIGVSSKRNAAPDFLEALRRQGWAAADAWVRDHLADDLGKRSSFNVEDEVTSRLKASPPGPSGDASTTTIPISWTSAQAGGQHG